MAEDLNSELSRKTLASDYRVEIRLTMLGLSGRRWLTLIFLPSPLKKNRPLLRRLAWPPNETKKFVNFTLARIPGGVLPRILDRGVPLGFVNPNPI